MADKIKPWEIIERRIAYQDNQITVNRHVYRTTWGVVVDDYPTIAFSDWTAVIALTPEFDIVLIRNYRPGAHRIFTEPPGGRIDAGEEPLTAAKRELMEETGYEARDYVALPTMMAAPARNAACAYGYLAFDAMKIAPQQLEPGEELELLTRPFAEYLREMTHSKEPVNAAHLAMVQSAASCLLSQTNPLMSELRKSIAEVLTG